MNPDASYDEALTEIEELTAERDALKDEVKLLRGFNIDLRDAICAESTSTFEACAIARKTREMQAKFAVVVELLHEFNRDCEDGVCDKCTGTYAFLASATP